MARVSSSLDPLLRRPLGILEAKPPYIWLYYQVQGGGTWLLSACATATAWIILGPLGNSFPEMPGKRVLLIAGGRGIVPLFHYAQTYGGRRPLLLLYGGRGKADLALLERIKSLTLQGLFIFSEDGSLGQKGLLTDGLEKIVREERPDATLSCGPDAMLAALAELLKGRGLQNLASLEARWAAASASATAARCRPSTAPTATSAMRGRCSPWRRSNGRPERRPGLLHPEEPADRGVGHLRLRRGIPAVLRSRHARRHRHEGDFQASRGREIRRRACTKPRPGCSIPSAWPDRAARQAAGDHPPPARARPAVPIIVNVCGEDDDEFVEVAAIFSRHGRSGHAGVEHLVPQRPQGGRLPGPGRRPHVPPGPPGQGAGRANR